MRRSDVTRSKILDAAQRRFAQDGYERATIRAIAADAGIDPSMVMRYYGNKEGLFAQAASFDLRLPDLSDVPREDVGRRLVRHFVQRWDGDETLMALLRAAATNESAAERMRAIFAEQLGPRIAQLNADNVPRRAGLTATQMLGVALCRYVLKLPPVVAMSEDDLVEDIGPTVQRYLLAS